MEDNIGGMMEEIRNVVSSHLNEVKHELHETVDVLNKLPLVISLRAQIRELQEQNKQLQLLLKETGEEKNIELEIMEVPKNDTSLEQEEGLEIPTDGSDENSGDDSEGEFDNALCADSADEDELGIAPENGEYMVDEEQTKPEKLTISNNDDDPRDI